MPSTPLRNVRVPDDVWLPAKARAREERTSVTAVVVEALREYGRSAASTEPPAPPPPEVVEEAIVPLERGPERRRKAPAKRAAAPESTAEAESEGERITAEIESDPDEVARLRHSRQQAREGKAVRWDGPGEPGSLAAAHALAEAVGAPMKMASDLPPAPKPPPAHDPTVPVFQEAGEDAYIPPLLAPDDEERPRKPCRHPASLIRPDGTCECGEEMYS